MENFFTWDYLLTFAGCALATGMITQGLKKLLPNVHEQILSYVIALVILIVGQLATKAMTGWDVAALDLVNAMVVSLSANGGYDAVVNAFGGRKEEKEEPEEDPYGLS